MNELDQYVSNKIASVFEANDNLDSEAKKESYIEAKLMDASTVAHTLEAEASEATKLKKELLGHIKDALDALASFGAAAEVE